MDVTTIEGVGNNNNPNPIQQNLATFNGTQCGFCSPGFVMQMYSLLEETPNPTPQDVEDRFDGNLCR